MIGCGRSPNLLSRSTSAQVSGGTSSAEASGGRVTSGRRQTRTDGGHARARRLAAQPGGERAQGEEIDRVGVVVARQHVIDAGRLHAREGSELRDDHGRAEAHGRLVRDAPQVERLHRGPGPRQRSFDRGEMTPHEIDHTHANNGADVGEEVGGLTRRRGFGDGGKRIVQAA